MSFNRLRLVLGDQLNRQHSWFEQPDSDTLYVLMEIKPESEYVTHHIQKITGIFGAMRAFAAQLEADGFSVRYFHINDADNRQSFRDNLAALIAEHGITQFEFQAPDEYRLDELLREDAESFGIDWACVSSEHFLTDRAELGAFFKGKKMFLMESFYRHMRKKHGVMMAGDQPEGGQWNYDAENRKKLPKNHVPPAPFLLEHDVSDIVADLEAAGLNSIGSVDAKHFIWPLTREEALKGFQYFLDELLPHFGSFQDALSNEFWSLYHSRISFAMNLKLIGPLEVVHATEAHWRANQSTISIAQCEGFIRQIIGWREYMRGIYWHHMPDYAQLNFFAANRTLPGWFWTGNTHMNCQRKAIGQSLQYGYAHHIQRLMVTGNFCLLAGIDPAEVDQWYLGIYVDAFDWVEITNTRGMSQFADGGIVGTKPYISSASYLHKMGDHCSGCRYDHKARTGENACPFNSLYWNFLDAHRNKLGNNPRMGMMYRVWDKFAPETKTDILETAQQHLENIENL